MCAQCAYQLLADSLKNIDRRVPRVPQSHMFCLNTRSDIETNSILSFSHLFIFCVCFFFFLLLLILFAACVRVYTHAHQKFFILPELTGNINHITIANCKRLHIRKGTFSRSGQLNRVTLENVDDLTMEAFALEFPVRMPTLKINVKFNRVSS